MHRSLTDFISAGIDTVVNVGQGINKGKFLCAVLAAAIATNAIAQPLQVNAPREQLSLSNYEQLIEARSNVVMDNPIAEGQVITFLFSKPSTEFLEVSFGKGFAQSEAYAGVKEIVESDSFYSSGLHVSYTETGGIDANFTSVNAPNVGEFQSKSDLFQNQLKDFTFWHEVYHSDPGQSTSSTLHDTQSSLLMAEIGADAFAAMVLAKKNAADTETSIQISLEIVDALIELRNFAGFDRDHVDAIHLTQTGLFALREAIVQGRVNPASMTLPEMKEIAGDISVAAMQADLSNLVTATIDSLPSRYAPASADFFAKHLRAAQANGLDHLKSLGQMRGEFFKGAVQASTHATADPVKMAEMISTDGGIAAYAKQMSEMPGGDAFKGNYDLTHPYAHLALKNAEATERESMLNAIGQKTFESMDKNGCFQASTIACMGSDQASYRSQLTLSNQGLAEKFSNSYSAVMKAVEAEQVTLQNLMPDQAKTPAGPSMR